MSAGITPGSPASGLSLEHLGDNIGLDANVTVHVKGPDDLFGLTLERALFHIEHFKEPGRTPLREGEHYAGFIVRSDSSAAHHLILRHLQPELAERCRTCANWNCST